MRKHRINLLTVVNLRPSISILHDREVPFSNKK
jgi:hypothetical protein